MDKRVGQSIVEHKKLCLLESYYNIVSKLPIASFSTLQEFEIETLSRLKQEITNISKQIISTTNVSASNNIDSMMSIDESLTGKMKHDNNDRSTPDAQEYFPSDLLLNKLREVFKLKDFRPNQINVLEATLRGNNCFVIMPTGAGKSLCYQLPAIITKGVTIVISPLTSLIDDQIFKLSALQVEARGLHGTLPLTKINNIYKELSTPNTIIKLLYVTPERIACCNIMNEVFDEMYANGNINSIVIDEAHCVSTWGRDFRPAYNKLGEFIKKYKSVPVMALTATATHRVRDDVVKQLGVNNFKIFTSSFNRSNLKYTVCRNMKKTRFEYIVDIIKNKFFTSSGLIYCITRNECDELAKNLLNFRIRAASYHAGLQDNCRKKIHTEWLNDENLVICATNAFGMGIDKQNIRFVIHYSIPKSIEDYYQECGRAGRDGKLAECILFYDYNDKLQIYRLIDNKNEDQKRLSLSNLNRIIDYCENITECRRSLQLTYFGEMFHRHNCMLDKYTSCDNCCNINVINETNQILIAKDCVEAVVNCCSQQDVTLTQFVDLLKGKKTEKLNKTGIHKSKFFGKLKTWDIFDIHRVFVKLLLNDHVTEKVIRNQYKCNVYLKPNSNSVQFISSEYQIPFMIALKCDFQKKSICLIEKTLDNQIEELSDTCYQELIRACEQIAAENKIQTNKMSLNILAKLCRLMPRTREDLQQTIHFEDDDYANYGYRFLKITKRFAKLRDSCKELSANELCVPGQTTNNINNYMKRDLNAKYAFVPTKRYKMQKD